MLILGTTTDKIQVILSNVVTTNQLDCIATYKDITTSAYSGSAPILVTTNNTTVVDLVGAPASNTQRIVDFISIYNNDTANATVTVRINRNGSIGILFRCTLTTSESLVYSEGAGWNIHSNNGSPKQFLSYDNSNITSNPNYIINSAFQVAQAATSATITAGTATPTASLGYPVVDSWFCYSVGGNPTLAQVVGSNTTANRLQLTGAASITSVGIGQRLEAIDTTSLANKTVTLSFECSNSLLTSLTVVANRPTTTANTFGTVGTPTKTLINSTNVAINSTLTRYSVTFTCPQEVDKGLEILFTLGAQTSGTFVLANVKLEEGGSASTFIPPIYSDELRRCQRYLSILPLSVYGYPSPSTGGYAAVQNYILPAVMRVAPVVSKTYSFLSNVATINAQNITPYFFTDQIVSTGFFNTTWYLTAICYSYIP